MGASPAKHNTMFMQRINRCCEPPRRRKNAPTPARGRPARGRTPFARPVGQMAREYRPRALRSSVSISPRGRFTFEISPDIDSSTEPRGFLVFLLGSPLRWLVLATPSCLATFVLLDGNSSGDFRGSATWRKCRILYDGAVRLGN